ncbi:MAG TPA: sigma-70 family RNA polymerase sigma factor [Acidimicrobiales bacterium]|nr:sigma-70 family RNA polymerase sigma factor [Acidimicrobiales bacterium]
MAPSNSEASGQPWARLSEWGHLTDPGDVGNPSDATLIVGIERGHQEALAEAHHRHGPSVYRLASRMCDGGEPGDAEDVTHEVFLALWRSPERYNPEGGSLRSHLLTHAYAGSVKRLRSGPPRPLGPHSQPGAVSRRRDHLPGDEAWRLLAELPEAKRQAIVSAYFGDHTYAEVAELLRQQGATVTTHLDACMTELRARLAVNAFFDKMGGGAEEMADPDTTTVDLTATLSEVARALFSAGGVEETLQAVVDQAAAAIDGCDFAGIFTVNGEEVATAVHSDPLVVEIDGLQQMTGEGPCLDAIEQQTTVYAEDLADDDRWTTFGPEAAAAGVRCALAYHLYANGTLGALNLYARYPRAFGATDRAKGLIFATLSGLALSGAHSHEDEDRRAGNLNQALATREIIGQAQGILMERERITADQAFDILRRASQHLNVKLREVAQDLVDTGDRPPTRPSNRPT